MREVSGIGFLLILVLPFYGAWQFFSIRIDHIKQQTSLLISNGIEEEHQVLFKFTEEESAQLTWEHSREFELNGEMYDVIRSEAKGDTTWYWCYRDQKETLAKNELRRMIVNALAQNPRDYNKQIQIGHFLSTLFVVPARHLPVNDISHWKTRADKPYHFSLAISFPNPPFHPPDHTFQKMV
jgi:hypothetical protein